MQKFNFKKIIAAVSVFRALRYKNFRLFFIGQGISLIGTWMQQLAMSWLVYRMTNSALLLGLVVFFGQLPALFVTPFAGVVVDRYNRQRLLLMTQTLSMLQALVLAMLVFTHHIAIWHIIALSIFIGLVNAFDIPLRQAFVIEMIEGKEDLGNAIALNSSLFNLARLIGPSLAGILIAVTGEGICFLLNSVSFLTVIVALLLMKINPRQINAKRAPILQELKTGFNYSFGFAPIRSILLLLSLVSLVGVPYQVLIPVFAKDILGGGSRTLGFLTGMAGAGALTGALFLAQRKSVIGLGRAIAWASGLFGCGIIIFSFSRLMWFSLIVIFFSGFGMMVQMASCNTVIQTIVDDDKRGRVMSFYTLAFMGTVPFGSLLAGFGASKIGAPSTLAIGGICCIGAALAFAKNLPTLRLMIRPIYAQKGIIPEAIKESRLPPGFDG